MVMITSNCTKKLICSEGQERQSNETQYMAENVWLN